MADDECGCLNGQRMVTDVWARQEAGIPRDADLPAIEAEVAEIQALYASLDWKEQATPTERLLIEQVAKYRAALNTVFPCPTCRPKQFARWRRGCYRPNHQAARCRLCKDDAK